MQDFRPLTLGLGLAGLVLMGGCAGASVMETTSDGGKADESGIAAMEAPSPEMAAPAADMMMESQRGIESPPMPGTEIGQAAPQLVKRATLVLTLTDIDGAIAQVQTVVRQAQGDLLSMEDIRNPEGTAHQVYMTLRVPQAQLEPTLTALRQLGTVQSQALSAEDVSSQLVDLSARIKNLRQSEVALQGIMERSGEISHVLEVARELSTVRDSIERLSAQEQNLKRQVAYSTIDLTLQSPMTAVPPLRPVRETLGNTWQTATQSVQAFTVGGLKIGLWLLAYSPYWVALALLIYGGYRMRPRRPIPTDTEQPSPP
ncbi:hypothetical protein GFS31_11010 [Leptolyngbya sp. BL0902]|uniref:DUF4349 domain-containing protein n=1 Tax=Leptolyngbya sp. BL0902 TaxID=1115757 RepID=UPI0018E79C38|nr:DUF4349 domain-containing protein [Leptolyngbya sp. BL0902]QQE64420.1 hypothetical protein GFS31_11010 [Leptolyngbya sp. BL0902]